MTSEADLLAGLLDGEEPTGVTWEDFAGPLGTSIRLWQRLGFLPREGVANPAPTCPYCRNGVPYRLGARHLCDRCHSTVDPRWVMLWPFDRGAFLRWLARGLHLRGDPVRVDAGLWQLGTWSGPAGAVECFYRVGGTLGPAGQVRLLAYRDALVLWGGTPPTTSDGFRGRTLSLHDVLDGTGVRDLGAMFRPRGHVRFDAHSGALWVGDTCVGEVPVASREYHFLERLAADLDHFVPYRDLKAHVLLRAGASDGADEATFCQKLKNRIKVRSIPRIDEFLVTTNKGDGYRLRGQAAL